MKTLLLLLISLSPQLLPAQEIPGKANTITIYDVSFDEVINKLQDMGYTTDKIEKENGLVKTGFRKVGKDNSTIHMEINIRHKNDVAVVTGFFTNGFNRYLPICAADNSEEKPLRVEYNKSPEARLVFRALQEFAISFSKGLLYEKR